MKILRTVCSCFSLLLLLSLMAVAGVAGAAEYYIPDSISVFAGEMPSSFALGSVTVEEEISLGAHARGACCTVRLFGVIPIKELTVKEYERISLCPGGGVFGISAPLDGVLVTSLSSVGEQSPARAAGLRCGDKITAVDGTPTKTALELSSAVAASGGRSLCLTVLRDGKQESITLTPAYDKASGAWRAGVGVKDCVSGIGTVTFVDPETGFFGGLGHGVYDGVSKLPVAVRRGAVTEVELSGVTRGAAGTPGELRGHLMTERLGTLLTNTDCGVFGMLLPDATVTEPAIPIALRHEVKTGKAEILSTLQNGKTERYSIEITDLRGNKGDGKSFSIRVTDERLLATAGGIVQGMSGSPIIQDGKLVGAVTHVLIGDPTAGYGIFIENMLSAAEMPRNKAA